jgi:hypothetical protein
MKSEMDIMGFDERQRHNWFRANRLTLMMVGLVWLGMIFWEIAHNRTPVFLIAMVPAFALFRLLSYWLYSKRK